MARWEEADARRFGKKGRRRKPPFPITSLQVMGANPQDLVIVTKVSADSAAADQALIDQVIASLNFDRD